MSDGKKQEQEIDEVYADLKNLSRDDLMKTYGFALGLSAKSHAVAEKPGA